MVKSALSGWIATSFCSFLAGSGHEAARASETQLLDVDVAGNPAVGNFEVDSKVALSDDGRYIAFASAAGSFLPGLSAGSSRVYLRDRVLGTTILVSRTSTGGVPQFDDSQLGSISSNGRYVTFMSSWKLDPAAPLSGTSAYLFDRITNAVELVSRDSSGVGVNATYSQNARAPLVTPDGRYVLFDSVQDLAGDTPTHEPTSRVYRRDRSLGTTLRVSQDPGGQNAPDCYGSGITAEGNRILYQAAGVFGSAPVPGIYVRDLALEIEQRINVDPFNQPLAGTTTTPLDWTEDGSIVVFQANNPNPNVGDGDSAADIYLSDWQQGTVEVLSNQWNGQPASGEAVSPSISNDGRYVAFAAKGSDFIPWDQNGLKNADVVVRDRVTQRDALVSVSNLGVQTPDASCTHPMISGDGRCVAFETKCDGWFPATGGQNHYYLRDRIGFTSLGYGKPGFGQTIPALTGSGSTAPGGSGSIDLTGAAPSALTALLLALDRTYTTLPSGPLSGSILAAASPIAVFTLVTGGNGEVHLPYVLPVGVPLVPEIYLQAAIVDSAAANGVAISSALLLGF